MTIDEINKLSGYDFRKAYAALRKATVVSGNVSVVDRKLLLEYLK